MKKIKEYLGFFKIILKSNIFYKLPQKKIVVFDNEQKIHNRLVFKPLLNDCFFLDVRFYNLKNFYINSNIFLFTIYNILKGNFNFGSYLAAVIKTVNPKVLITTIDYSHQFHNVCKILRKKGIRMIAVQRSTRETIQYFKKKELSKIYIPEYFCFGKNEIDLFKKMNVNVEKFKIIGSTKLSNFLIHFKNKKKNNFDICLVAEYPYHLNAGEESSQSQKIIGNLLSYLNKFVKKNKLKLVIVGKRPKRNNNFFNQKLPSNVKYDKYIAERKFYKKFIKTKHLFVPQNNRTLTSYKYSMQSKVTIGTTSTILRELLSINKKILACNPTGLKKAKFPIQGACYLENFDYYKFEKKLKTILSMSKTEYYKKLNKDPNYLVKFDKNFLANDVIVKEIKNTLNHA